MATDLSMICIQQHNALMQLASMSQGALKDLIRCIHFDDDWDDTGWDAFLHSTKEAPKTRTAQHRKKYAQLEDAYNAR